MQWSSLGSLAPPVRSRLLPGMTGLLLDTFALIGEIAVGHSRFGRRYLTIFGVVAGYVVLIGLPWVVVGVFAFFFSSVELGLLSGLFAVGMAASLGANGTVLYTTFTWGFLGRSVWLLLDGEYRRRAGEPIPSTYSGRPSPLWELIPFGPALNEGRIKRYGEPLLLLAVAYFLSNTDLLLALYLGTSAIAMFVKGQLEHRILSHQAADLDDQVFDSAGLSARFGGTTTPNQPHGIAQPAAVLTGHDANSEAPRWAAAASDYRTILNAPLPETVAVLDDWYLTDEEPSPAPVSASTVSLATKSLSRTKVRCPHCGQVGMVPIRQGKRRMLCHGCDRQFHAETPSAH